jgi:hypothetical protein
MIKDEIGVDDRISWSREATPASILRMTLASFELMDALAMRIVESVAVRRWFSIK